MIKLFKDSKKLCVFNLIIVLSLMFSFISYYIYAEQNEHLVVEASKSTNAEKKSVFEFKSDYLEEKKEFKEKTPLYKNDLSTYKAFLTLEDGAIMLKESDMGGLSYDGQNRVLEKSSSIFERLAGSDGIDKKIWSSYGTKFEDSAINREKPNITSYKSAYNVTDRKSSETDYIAYVPNGSEDVYSDLEDKSVFQELYSEYKIKQKDTNMDDAEKYILSNLGSSDISSNDYPNYVQKALWKYRYRNGLSEGEVSDDGDVGDQRIDELLVGKAEEYKNSTKDITDSQLLNVKWKSGTEKGINFDNVTVNYDAKINSYIVGPFAVEYDNSITSFKDMATFELYTNADVDGVDLQGIQNRFSIIHCDKNNGKVISGYEELDKNFPESGEPFYVRYQFSYEDINYMTEEEFLTLPRMITNIKIKVRVEKAEVKADLLSGKGYYQEFIVKSKEKKQGDIVVGKYYYLEPKGIVSRNWAELYHVKESKLSYEVKEVNKYLDIKIGKLLINSELFDSNEYDESTRLDSSEELKYKIEVTGNIFEYGGDPEDYTSEEIKVPLSGQVISRDYAWVGNKNPKYKVTIENYNSKYYELMDNTVGVEKSVVGNAENETVFEKNDIEVKEENKFELNGELENGITTLNYKYVAKFDNKIVEDDDSLFSYGKIVIDNIVHHDASLLDENFSLKYATQAYLLTITPGENSSFIYCDPKSEIDQVYAMNNAYKRLVILYGRDEEDNVILQHIENNVLEVGNRFETGKIKWPKDSNGPQYTIERLDDIEGSDEEIYNNSFIEKYIRSTNEEGDISNRHAYFTDEIDILNSSEYRKESMLGNIPDERWADEIENLGIHTYRAILNEEETMNTSGFVSSIDKINDEEYGLTIAKFVSDHRKETGEISFEKRIDIENDEYFKNLSPEEITDLFEVLKDDITFEFEIGIGTDVQTITLDKNYREPNYDKNGNISGYKWIWKSGERQWLTGNELYYTIKDNLNCESVLFSRIAEPEYSVTGKRAYDIHGNIATGSFIDFKKIQGKASNKDEQNIIFYGTFVYEECGIKIVENLRDAVYEETDASPIKHYENNDKNNIRNLLSGSTLFFNIEVNGLFAYDKYGIGNHNYRITNDSPIDLNSTESNNTVENEYIMELPEEGLNTALINNDDNRKFIWIKGIPPKYKIEQDTERIIANEVQKNTGSNGESTGKDLDALRDIVSWQIKGVKEGELRSDINYYQGDETRINEGNSMTFEYTNDVPSIDRNLKTGRLFIKQYVYGSDDYLKEIQKGFEFTFDVKVMARRKNTVEEDPNNKKRSLVLLNIDNLVIKSEVADDGNYVWEWTSPEITWDADYMDTPEYVVTIDRSKLPVGMKLDQIEKSSSDVNVQAENRNARIRNDKNDYSISDKLTETGKNENKEELAITNEERELIVKDIDERMETTDVYFYASYGVAKKSKIKLIQSLTSNSLLKKNKDERTKYVRIAVKGNFTYNNEEYNSGTWYLTPDKRLTQNKADAEISLEVGDDLVESYISNYFSWNGDSPEFWIETETDHYRTTYPSPSEKEPMPIESPTGLMTIVDSYYKDSQSNSASFSITISKNDDGHDFDLSLPEEYEKSTDIYFKVHIDNRMDTYVKAVYTGGGVWKYIGQDIKYNPNDNVSYIISAVNSNPYLDIFYPDPNGYLKMTIGKMDNIKNSWKYKVQDKTIEAKGRYHIVALRKNNQGIASTNFKIDMDGINIGNSIPKHLEETLTFNDGEYSTEYYSDYFYTEDKMVPYYLSAEGQVDGVSMPYYWKTNSGQLIESDNRELINIVVDYSYGEKGTNKETEVIVQKRYDRDEELPSGYEKSVLRNISSTTNISLRPAFITDVYVQGYGTKKLILYGKNLTDPYGKADLKADIDDLLTWRTQTVFYDGKNWKFAESSIENKTLNLSDYAENPSKYMLDSADFLNYKIVDYELPIGYEYEKSEDYIAGQDIGILKGSSTANFKENKLKYNINKFPVSKTLAIENKYVDGKVKNAKVKYVAEVSGTYQYIVNNKVRSVVNSTKEFWADATGNGIFAFEEDGSPIRFIWEEDNQAPRYSISLASSGNASNIQMVNAAGYLGDTAVTFATARNQYSNVGGYIYVSYLFKDENGENIGIKPSRKFEFIATAYKKNSEDKFILINEFVGELSSNKQEWMSPRITWCDGEKVYYKIKPINCDDYMQDIEIKIKDSDVEKIENKDKYGDEFIELKPHNYESLMYSQPKTGAHTVIIYKVKLQETKLTFKNTRIHMQEPKNKNDLNQVFDVSVKLDGNYIDITNGAKEGKDSNTSMHFSLKASSSESKNNENGEGSSAELRILHFPDEKLKISVDEEIKDGEKPDNWKNINISNTENYIVGSDDVTIYLTNQYSEFKMIDLTTKVGGKVTMSDGSVPEKSIEVYANQIDDYGVNLVSIDKFGVIRSQPAYTNIKTGKWEMTGILIPQLYTQAFQFMYKYDGQMYEAINEFDEDDVDMYINNPNKRNDYKDIAKVHESAYERQKFNEKFENISGKEKQNVNRESIASVSKNEKSMDAMYSSKLIYDETGAVIGIASTIQNTSSNLIKDEFAMTASTMVLSDESCEIIDDQDNEYDVDYEDEESYEYIMKFPFDSQLSTGKSDLTLESPNSLDTDEDSDTYGTKKKVFRSNSYLKDINLKLKKRSDVEISTQNELLNIRSVVNGVKKDLYDIDGGTDENRIECSINSTDYYYRADVYRQNDKYVYLRKLYDSKGYNLDDTEMEIYLTYKYVLENNSDDYVIKVNELENYISNSMEIVNISEGEVAKNIGYCPTNEEIKSKTNEDESIAGSSYLKELYGEDDNKHYDDFTYKIIPEYKVSTKVVANQDDSESINDEVSFDKVVIYLQDKSKNEKGIYLYKDEPQEIYVDYRIRKKNIEGVNNTLDIGSVIKNIIEIGKYSVYEADEFSEEDKKLAGKISCNFAPNNLNLTQCYSSHIYESDTSKCDKNIVFKVDYGAIGVNGKSGTVYEKNNDGSKEALIGGMTVQLLERMYISSPEGKYKGEDFLWATDNQLGVYGGKSFYEAQLNSAAQSGMEVLAEENRFRSTVETGKKGQIGVYSFNNIPNGKFVARVLYGFEKGNLDNTVDTNGEAVALNNDGSYYSKEINGGEVLTANFNGDKTGATPAVYNGQDYKSAYTEESEDGFVPYGDDEARRLETMACDMTFTNENTRIFAKLNDKTAIHQKIYDNYYMYLMSNTINDRNESEFIENEDFAITKRPQTQIYLDQQIENIKIITNDGKTIFDAKYNISYDVGDSSKDENSQRDSGYEIKRIEGKDQSIYANISLDKSKSIGIDMLQELYKKEYKITNDLERYGNENVNKRNFKYINIDDVILQGTTVEINYRISAINVSESDYISSNIEKYISSNNSTIGSDNVDFGIYYNQNKLRKVAQNIRESISQRLGEDEGIENKIAFGSELGKYFYTRQIQEDLKPVKTRVRQLLNYVDNDTVFSMNYNDTDNNYWRTSSAAELNGNGLDRNRMVETGQIDIYKVVDKNDMAYFTTERNNIAVSVDIINGEGVNNSEFEQLTVPYEYYQSHKDEQQGEDLECITHMNLVTTKTVNSLNQADNMSYDTLTEIVKYENTAGRRDEIMHIGNANPKDGEFETTLLERDSSSAEIVTFMPPTGLGEKNKKLVYIIISSIMLCTIVGITIVLVKKNDNTDLDIMEIVDGKIITGKNKKAEK